MGTGCEVQVFRPKAAQFAGAQPGGVQKFQHGLVPQFGEPLTERLLQQRRHLVLAQRAGQRQARPLHLYAGGGVRGGASVFERIRKGRPDLRFLFASGYSMNAIHTNFVLDEGMTLLQKPYQRDSLLRAVRKALDS